MIAQTGQTRKANIFLRALSHRNYRLFFIGQGISFIGTWMHRIALGWLVLRITDDSEKALGIIGFASLMPTFLIAPFAGVLADRVDRRKLIIYSNLFAGMLTMMIAILTIAEIIELWHIITIGILVGVAAGFDIPSRHAFVAEIVEKRENLGNAIALNSFLFNIARVLGPVFAAWVVDLTGEGLCFLINSMTFFVAIFMLMKVRLAIKKKHAGTNGVFSRFWEGVTYSMKSRLIRSIIFFLGFLSLIVMPYFTLLPVFAKTVLQGDVRTFGFLAMATGTGSLIGLYFLASRPGILGLERWITGTTALFGAGCIAFSYSKTFLLSMFIAPFCGAGMVMSLAACNTIIQTYVDEDKRGRVMSFYTMAFMGMAPFGSLIAGYGGDLLGAPMTVHLSGTACLIASAIFWTRTDSIGQTIHVLHSKMNAPAEAPPGIN